MAIRSAAFLVAFLLTCQFSVGALQAQSMVLGYSGSGISTDLRRVIEKEKIWKKHGLNVRSVYFISGGILSRAMASGDISVSDSDVPAMLNLAVSGLLDLKVIAVTINRLEHYFIVHKAIARPEDLKGKRVAVSGIGSASDITTRMVLRFWKLNPEKDLTILASGNTPTRIAALTVGHVDAGLVSPDHVNRVLATGCCRILADLAELPMDYARFGVVMPTAMLREQRETARKLLNAYIEGIQTFKSRPEVVFSVLKEEGIKDPKVAKEVYDRVSKSLREYPVPEPKGIQSALDSLPSPKARSAKAEDFMDASLIEDIRKSGFIDRLYGR
ncbi:MAG: ABC transporter substrate-binding protein [Deltaproteobacteria bacterium]|nr:ABC transporter substrate-binding protein [Deltaproteobacteria bacterium]